MQKVRLEDLHLISPSLAFNLVSGFDIVETESNYWHMYQTENNSSISSGHSGFASIISGSAAIQDWLHCIEQTLNKLPTRRINFYGEIPASSKGLDEFSARILLKEIANHPKTIIVPMMSPVFKTKQNAYEIITLTNDWERINKQLLNGFESNFPSATKRNEIRSALRDPQCEIYGRMGSFSLNSELQDISNQWAVSKGLQGNSIWGEYLDASKYKESLRMFQVQIISRGRPEAHLAALSFGKTAQFLFHHSIDAARRNRTNALAIASLLRVCAGQVDIFDFGAQYFDPRNNAQNLHSWKLGFATNTVATPAFRMFKDIPSFIVSKVRDDLRKHRGR